MNFEIDFYNDITNGHTSNLSHPTPQPVRTRLGLKSGLNKSGTGSRGGNKDKDKINLNENITGESVIKMKYIHPGSVYGCSWCPHDSKIIVTCCLDHKLRVFDYTLQGYICIFYYLNVDSLPYAFGWSVFLCRIMHFVTTSL
jgi:WD40 repeat protein